MNGWGCVLAFFGWSQAGSRGEEEGGRQLLVLAVWPAAAGLLGWLLQKEGQRSFFCTVWLLSVCIFSLSPST